MNYYRGPQPGCVRPKQVCVAPPKVNVVPRYSYKDVIHVQPYHTHYVNTHINCHKCVPTYSCSSEYKCKDVFSNSCQCGFPRY